MTKTVWSLTALVIAILGSFALGYVHPYDCMIASYGNSYTAGSPSVSSAGSNTTAVTTGSAGAPNALAICQNYNMAPPVSANASASRKDAGFFELLYTGHWDVYYDVKDVFYLHVHAVAQNSATGTGTAVAWIRDLPSGATLNVPITATQSTPGSTSTTLNPVLVLHCGVGLVGDQSTYYIEYETKSTTGATSVDEADGYGEAKSSAYPAVVIITDAQHVCP